MDEMKDGNGCADIERLFTKRIVTLGRFDSMTLLEGCSVHLLVNGEPKAPFKKGDKLRMEISYSVPRDAEC